MNNKFFAMWIKGIYFILFTKSTDEINETRDETVENTKPLGEINKIRDKTVENTKPLGEIDFYIDYKLFNTEVIYK